MRDDRKLVVVTGGLTKPVVRIYTAAGQAMAAFAWDHGRIAAMGWTAEEDLLILEDSGEVWACELVHHVVHCTRVALMDGSRMWQTGRCMRQPAMLRSLCVLRAVNMFYKADTARQQYHPRAGCGYVL